MLDTRKTLIHRHQALADCSDVLAARHVEKSELAAPMIAHAFLRAGAKRRRGGRNAGEFLRAKKRRADRVDALFELGDGRADLVCGIGGLAARRAGFAPAAGSRFA